MSAGGEARDFHEVWWIFSAREEAWGGLRIAHFRKATNGPLIVIITGELPHRTGPRDWESVRTSEGWHKIERIAVPTRETVAAALQSGPASIDHGTIRDYARDRFRRDLEDLLDDPSGVADDVGAEIAGKRRLAAALGLDFDGLVATLGSEFERERLRRLEAPSIAVP